MKGLPVARDYLRSENGPLNKLNNFMLNPSTRFCFMTVRQTHFSTMCFWSLLYRRNKECSYREGLWNKELNNFRNFPFISKWKQQQMNRYNAFRLFLDFVLLNLLLLSLMSLFLLFLFWWGTPFLKFLKKDTILPEKKIYHDFHRSSIDTGVLR